MVKLGEINPIVWDKVVEHMEFKLQDSGLEFQAEDIAFNWRQSTDANRLQREIFAKYGYFKDIILHPTFQVWKQWFDERVTWDLFLDEGESLAPASVVVIILSMIYSRVSKDAFALIAAFLFNVNPIYVVLAMLIYWSFFYGGLKPKKYRTKVLKVIKEPISRHQPLSFHEDKLASDDKAKEMFQQMQGKDSRVLKYDHILIGNDISTLYCAAILSRVGHKCLVIEPVGGLIQQCYLEGLPPIPLSSLVVGKPERYQHYFDLVQSKRDKESRVKFSPLGSERDGYTHTVLRVLPPSQNNKSLSQKPQRGPLADIVSFHTEEGNITSSIASAAALDKPAFKTFSDTITVALNSLHSYLITKVLGGEKDSQIETMSKSQGLIDFMNLCTHNIGDVLDRSQQDSLAYGILNGVSVIGSEENLLPTDASGLGLALFLANAENGLYYPSGGFEAIKKSLIHAIRVAGGEVLGDVSVQNITIDESSSKNKQPKATGVNTIINGEYIVFKASQSVISGVGVLATFTRLVSSDFVSEDMETKLTSLTEARPKVHVVYTIDTSSSADILGLRSADYYEVGTDFESMKWLITKQNSNIISPSQTSSTFQSSAKESTLISSYCRISCPSVQDPLWSGCSSNTNSCHVIVVEFELVEPAATVKPHRFSKSTHLDNNNSNSTNTNTPFSTLNNGPKMYTSSYLESGGHSSSSNVRLSLGDDIILSRTQSDRIIASADNKLRQVYPRIFSSIEGGSSDNYMTTSRIVNKTVIPARLGGFRLSSIPAKYGAKINSPTDIEGLYLCGKDIASPGLMGDVQGAWVASNAVLGYSAHELIMGRNITTDLENIPIKY